MKTFNYYLQDSQTKQFTVSHAPVKGDNYIQVKGNILNHHRLSETIGNGVVDETGKHLTLFIFDNGNKLK